MGIAMYQNKVNTMTKPNSRRKRCDVILSIPQMEFSHVTVWESRSWFYGCGIRLTFCFFHSKWCNDQIVLLYNRQMKIYDFNGYNTWNRAKEKSNRHRTFRTPAPYT